MHHLQAAFLIQLRLGLMAAVGSKIMRLVSIKATAPTSLLYFKNGLVLEMAHCFASTTIHQGQFISAADKSHYFSCTFPLPPNQQLMIRGVLQ